MCNGDCCISCGMVAFCMLVLFARALGLHIHLRKEDAGDMLVTPSDTEDSESQMGSV